MSNNKQSMKLYTEEEIKRGLDNPVLFEMTTDEFINSLIPIGLPSDEEIQKESLKTDFEYTFRNGAKWMRDKIQGGNK
jgi:hypothetical protein